jgi:hypothetical protein
MMTQSLGLTPHARCIGPGRFIAMVRRNQTRVWVGPQVHEGQHAQRTARAEAAAFVEKWAYSEWVSIQQSGKAPEGRVAFIWGSNRKRT